MARGGRRGEAAKTFCDAKARGDAWPCHACGEPVLVTELMMSFARTGRSFGWCSSCWTTMVTHYLARKVGARQRRTHLKLRYNLTVEEYERMFLLQAGRCAICHELPEKGLVVDHDHGTGKVRGLLCDACNRGIGFLRDNQDALNRAAEYVSRY